MSGGRHRHRFWGDRPRGLRPLTVLALCCVVAVLAVLATQATHPYGTGQTSTAAADGGNTDSTDPSASDPSTDEPSTDPAADNTDEPSPPATTTEPAPVPAPPAAPAGQNSAPVPEPVPVPVPDPGQPTPTATATPSPSPAPPPGPVSYEAESSTNTLAGTRIMSCATCSGGKKVGYVGKANTLQFNNVAWGKGGSVLLVISYINGDTTSRKAQISIDGGTPVTISFGSTNNWTNVRTLTLKVIINPGANRITLGYPSAYGPDIDRITLRSQ